MTDAFEAACAVVAVQIERRESDDPADPGGLTKWGLASKFHPEVLRDEFSYADALAIYRLQYWDRHACGAMPWAWALGVFDGAVNPASDDPVRLAQHALRLAADGVAGGQTIAAMIRSPADSDAFRLFLALRGVAYAREPGFLTFGAGWMKRLLVVHGAALRGI